jgi:hypothetical protein
MNYPVTFSFKIIAIVSQIYVRDGGGTLIGYVRQKFFKLREAVEVFADENQSQLLGKINADRMIDFNARYQFTAADGRRLGAMARRGLRSLWKAHYVIENAQETPALEIHEESAWVKFLDSAVGEIPIIGLFTGYFLNPVYLVTRPDGTLVARITKHRSFLESRFILQPVATLGDDEEESLLFGTLMLLLLERQRG